MSRPVLRFVTGNKNKLKEVQQIFGQHFQVDNVDIDLDEYQGEPYHIARKKCKDAVQAILKHNKDDIVGVLIEDTCLGFNAHGGLPGPYIKYYLKKLGIDGLPKMLVAFDDKTAQATCIFALAESCDDKIDIKLFKGTIDGEIVSPRGTTQFGWDPIFQPINSDKTFAEMSAAEKNAISHRSRALAALKAYLDQKNVEYCDSVFDAEELRERLNLDEITTDWLKKKPKNDNSLILVLSYQNDFLKNKQVITTALANSGATLISDNVFKFDNWATLSAAKDYVQINMRWCIFHPNPSIAQQLDIDQQSTITSRAIYWSPDVAGKFTVMPRESFTF